MEATSVQKGLFSKNENKEKMIGNGARHKPLAFLLTVAFTDHAIFCNLLPDSPFPS